MRCPCPLAAARPLFTSVSSPPWPSIDGGASTCNQRIASARLAGKSSSTTGLWSTGFAPRGLLRHLVEPAGRRSDRPLLGDTITGAIGTPATGADDVLREVDVGMVRVGAADSEERRALVPKMSTAARGTRSRMSLASRTAIPTSSNVSAPRLPALVSTSANTSPESAGAIPYHGGWPVRFSQKAEPVSDLRRVVAGAIEIVL